MRLIVTNEDKLFEPVKRVAKPLTEKQQKKKQRNLLNQQRIKQRKASEPSKGEQAIMGWCKKRCIRFTREHTIKAISIQGYQLFLDFFLRDYKVVVEFDGIQHFKPIYGQDKLESQQRKDRTKDRLCHQEGLKVLRISYLDIDRVDEKMTRFLKNITPKKFRAKMNHEIVFGVRVGSF